MEVLDPRPLVGGCRCTASPTQKTRPRAMVVAKWWFTVQGSREVTRISKSSVPTSCTASSRANSSVISGGPAAAS